MSWETEREIAGGKLLLRRISMGNDAVFLLTAGTAHIGATATASPSAEGDETIRHEYTLPGHREGRLAAELAQLAAETLQCTATVIAGIHLERPTREEIEEVVRASKEAMKVLLEKE
ncbi:hypothetical protein MO973_23125 [Paenibacillus sp. TRM 82003]|nr:hypothetical protein [Paenibacillus sp. TRM 82003]